MIAIVDYGVGNLFSLESSFKAIGVEAVVTCDKKVIQSADKIILPGVGAFGDAAEKLALSGLKDVVIAQAKSGKPLMGICLGMQMLFEKSFEYGVHDGLGLIKGQIKPIKEVIPDGLKIPHIGWNSLKFCKGSKLFKYIKDGDTKRNTLTEFNSNNTLRLDVEGTKAKIAALSYIKEELAKMGK